MFKVKDQGQGHSVK